MEGVSALLVHLGNRASYLFTSVNKQNNTRYIRDRNGGGDRRWHVYGCRCDAPNPANHWPDL